MLHLQRHNESHIHSIVRFRPGLKQHILPSLNLIDESKFSFCVPHDSYVLGLSDLKRNKKPMATKYCTRTIEVSDKNKFMVIYDVGENERRVSRIIRAQIDSKYLNKYKRSLKVAMDIIENIGKEHEFEIRHLNINALNIEAIWIHQDNSEHDVFLPFLSPIGYIKPFVCYKAKEFYSLTRDVLNRDSIAC